MASVKYEKISEPLTLGEGPHWDYESHVLYFVDMVPKKIYKYDPKTNKYTYAVIDREGYPSIIIPISGQKNKFLTTIQRDICLMIWDGESTRPESIEILATLGEEHGKCINDGKVDGRGRLWSGTLGETNEELSANNDNVIYCFGKDRIPRVCERKILLSNGLGWSPDNKFMYHVDSFAYKVAVFDFDLEKGDISNRRTLIDFKQEGIEGAPDGMTVDADGNLWITVFTDKRIIQVDPISGKVMRSVPIPAVNVASIAFGGQNLDELFVTTGYCMADAEELKVYPDSGCTFRLMGLGVKGLPAEPFVI